MRFRLVYIFKVFVFILLWVEIPIVQGKEKKYVCPLGFTLFYAKGHRYCLRLKDRETFSDKYKDCAGNLFNLKFYNEFKSEFSEVPVWTGYKSFYFGGTFIDWSYTKSTGDIFASENVTIDYFNFSDLKGQEICLIVNNNNTVSNFKTVKCNDKYWRFCVVKPYIKEKNMTNRDCEGLNDSLRFWSPQSTCLSALTGVGGANVRATWNQAQDLCTSKGGSLLNRGWIYSNYAKFSIPEMDRIYPLGIIMSNDYSLLRYDAINDHSEIPNDEWNFKYVPNNTDTLLGSLHNDVWELVNGSYIFYNVICEHVVPLKTVEMVLTLDLEHKLTLTVNDTLDEDDVYCFTDSKKPYPVKIKIKHIDDTNMFVLRPEDDGYYWCTHINTKNFKTAESNKVLFIREKESLINTYAVECMKYMNVCNETDLKNKILRFNFGNNTEYEDYENDEYTRMKLYEIEDYKNKWSLNMKLKKLFIDGSYQLVHIDLYPDLKPVPSYFLFNGETSIYMKPVYFCNAVDSIPRMALGESIQTEDCKTHSCVGDFNEGVQVVTTATLNCALDTKRLTAQVEILMPTIIPTTTKSPDITMEYPDYPGTADFIDSPIFGSPENPDLPENCDDCENSDDAVSGCFCFQQPESTTEYTKRPTPFPSKPTEVVTVTTPPITVDTTTEFVTTTEFITTTVNVLPTTPEPFTTTTAAPEEQLQQVLDDLDRLVNGSTPVMVDDISDVFNQVDNILVHDNLGIPGQLLHLLDRLGSAVELNGSSSAATVRDNIALLIADASPNNPVRGLRIATRDNDMFSNDAFEIFSGEPNSTTLDADRNEVVVSLPQSVSEETHRISFVVFRNDRAFQSNDGYLSVNSRVLSIKIGNVTKFPDGEVIDIHLSPMTPSPYRNVSRTCAYWEFFDNETGRWSQDGCTLIRATEGMLDTCRCTHLTHFAEVLFPRSVFSQENEDALELLTIIGCCLSILGLILVAVTAGTFRSWRRDFSNKIWLQLCIAIFLLAMNFLGIIFAKFDHYNIFCMIMGIVLHYSVLTSFCWMLVAAVLSYRRLVLVFTRDASHKLLRASAFAWGAPCAVIGVLLSIDPQSYEGRFEDKSPSGSFCYPSGLALWLSVYAPIASILLVNWTLFFLIVRSVFASRRIQRHGDSKEALRCASVSCLLVFLFGLPWIFGLFAFNIIAAYLFTITATFQGFMLFLFFVLGNKKTRDLWLNKLKIKQSRKVPVTSSTYSNRSTGWRGVTQGMTEVKVAKPKSLAQDDSRFS